MQKLSNFAQSVVVSPFPLAFSPHTAQVLSVLIFLRDGSVIRLQVTVRTFVAQSDLEPLARSVGCYVDELLSRLGGKDHYVELRMFPTRTAMRWGLLHELVDLELPGSLAVPDFATLHEAFAGYPRIWISSGDADLNNPTSRARLQHEVGHAVLHWEISAYILPTPATLSVLVERGAISRDNASAFAYMLSTAVKDFEVSTLLDRFGIREDQIIFYLQELETAGGNGQAILGSMSELKVLMGAYPFRHDLAILKAVNRATARLGALQGAAKDALSSLAQNPDLDLANKIELVCKALAPAIR